MIRSTGYLLWRLLRIIFGFALLLAGLALSIPGVPGPGIVVVVLALGVLSRDFHWAERIRLYIHNKWHELRNRQSNTDPTRENHHG
jgi:Putative transmembrane protein (PGPGW)